VTGDPKPAEGLQIVNDIAFGAFQRRIRLLARPSRRLLYHLASIPTPHGT
jgi:hypothetical protein